MRTPLALAFGLTGAALGIAHLVALTRHHKATQHLALVRLHAQALSDVPSDPRLSGTEWDGIDPDETARRLMANRWVTLWSTMLRFGYLNRTDIRQAAMRFMEHPSHRAYWKRGCGSTRQIGRSGH
ncbi:DUF6082 family protein [Streptomyces sp. NPDC057336]|uniref:DUF6082 family protein n=1 Tax=Streptomyces sp. NPDC057336 TaxID=3346102 RepID=UPI00363625EE